MHGQQYIKTLFYVFRIVLRIKNDDTEERHSAHDLCDKVAVCFLLEFVEQNSNM